MKINAPGVPHPSGNIAVVAGVLVAIGGVGVDGGWLRPALVGAGAALGVLYLVWWCRWRWTTRQKILRKLWMILHDSCSVILAGAGWTPWQRDQEDHHAVLRADEADHVRCAVPRARSGDWPRG